MKSSSQLFPVELVSADIRGDVYQDLYSLKPNRSRDKSVEIALLHLHKTPVIENAPQVLFVHDIFQSHWQWMDAGPYEDMVSSLVESGHSVWLMDWRAHGSSKINRDQHLNRLQAMAEEDLVSVVEFIHEKSLADCSIIASGFGAQMAQRAAPGLQKVHKYVFVEAESLIPSKKYWLPGYRLFKFSRLLGKDWVKGRGSEVESAALFRELLWESGLFGRRNVASRQQAIMELKQQAGRITWICTARVHEQRAQRVLRKQATTLQVKAAELPSAILNLVSA